VINYDYDAVVERRCYAHAATVRAVSNDALMLMLLMLMGKVWFLGLGANTPPFSHFTLPSSTS